MATKMIKFDLLLKGVKVTNFDELQENFSADILPIFQSGRLAKFLKSRELPEQAQAIAAIDLGGTELQQLAAICRVLELDDDEDVLQCLLDERQAAATSAASTSQTAQAPQEEVTTLTGVDWSGQDMSGRQFIGEDLRNANLKGTNFSKSDLSGADLTGADLSGANLRYTILNNVNFTDANLSNSYLHHDEYNFQVTTSENINFSNANLTSVYLDYCGFISANFTGANLTKASIKNAFLPDANFTKADLSFADLTGTTFQEKPESVISCDKIKEIMRRISISPKFVGAYLTDNFIISGSGISQSHWFENKPKQGFNYMPFLECIRFNSSGEFILCADETSDTLTAYNLNARGAALSVDTIILNKNINVTGNDLFCGDNDIVFNFTGTNINIVSDNHTSKNFKPLDRTKFSEYEGGLIILSLFTLNNPNKIKDRYGYSNYLEELANSYAGKISYQACILYEIYSFVSSYLKIPVVSQAALSDTIKIAQACWISPGDIKSMEGKSLYIRPKKVLISNFERKISKRILVKVFERKVNLTNAKLTGVAGLVRPYGC